MANSPFEIELDDLTLARARRGDLDACESIFRKFNQPAYSVAYRVCQCRELAQEITQEAFITVFRKFRHAKAFVRVLFEVAHALEPGQMREIRIVISRQTYKPPTSVVIVPDSYLYN